MKSKKPLVYLLLATPAISHAELPLTIEDLISEKGKIRLESSISYTNTDRNSVGVGEPLVVQTGPTSFVSIPTRVGEIQRNDDLLIATIGIRYGLTNRTEIYGRGSYLYDRHRSSGDFGSTSTTESRFLDAWIGANYRFKFDDETPAVIGFAEASIREKDSTGSRSFKSNMIGVTTYKSIDPVVFSFTSAYQFNRSHTTNFNEYKSGNLLLLTPSISFAANSLVTLSAGFQWSNRQADQFNQRSLGSRKTSTSINLGVSYSVDQKNSIGLSMRTNSSGRDGAGLRLGWLSSI